MRLQRYYAWSRITAIDPYVAVFNYCPGRILLHARKFINSYIYTRGADSLTSFSPDCGAVEARFLVADLCELPESARSVDCPFATVSNAFKSFCLFADIQLSSQINSDLEKGMIAVFKQLLSLQDFLPSIDRRISRALEYIDDDISKQHSLDELAGISSLSVSQFKVLFVKHTRKTPSQYLLMLRMEKARALLANTDMPVNMVAENTGYADQSAFTRRFQNYHGVSPGEYRKRQVS
jgi:AraC-like DNA-binding protein